MTAARQQLASDPLWLSAMPGLFVVLWSTGFIGAKFGLPYAEPLTFLALRFAIVAALMLAVSLSAGAAWPRSWPEAGHTMMVGILMQGTYLGGVYFAIAHGISAGLSALIVGLQPVLTAGLAGFFLGEVVRPLQWLGVVLGFAGIVLVVADKLSFDGGHLAGLAANLAALAGITAGTLYQKRFGRGDLRSVTVLQNAAAALALFLLACRFETLRIVWSPTFLLAMAWLCIVLSIGATMLLLYLLRRGAASRTASLFYLVPPVTAFMAFLLFGETLGPEAIAGMAASVAGVALVNRG